MFTKTKKYFLLLQHNGNKIKTKLIINIFQRYNTLQFPKYENSTCPLMPMFMFCDQAAAVKHKPYDQHGLKLFLR